MVAPPPEGGSDGAGVVILEQGEGALLLKDEAERAWRLSWERTGADPVPEDRRRALPEGRYRIVGYRAVDRSRADAVWYLSASGKLGELEVEAGATQRVALDRTIRIKKRARDGQVGMNIQGAERAGLSIYRDGRRIPIRYRLTGADGERLDEGPMTYG